MIDYDVWRNIETYYNKAAFCILIVCCERSVYKKSVSYMKSHTLNYIYYLLSISIYYYLTESYNIRIYTIHIYTYYSYYSVITYRAL